MNIDINIISNCCAGGYFYRDYLRIKYLNPFIWNFITYKNMFNLIKNYNNINFKNIELKKYKEVIKHKGELSSLEYNTCVALNIDNVFDVAFPHNIYNPNNETPIINQINIQYKRNFELTYNNWLKRVDRMNKINKNIKPIFLIITQNIIDFTYHNSLNLLKTFPNSKIIMITSYKQLLNENTLNHKIIFYDNVNTTPEKILKTCYRHIYDFILKVYSV